MTRQAPHGAFPEINHDEMARQDFVLRLREYVAGDIVGGNDTVYKHAVEPAFERAEGRKPATRKEARQAMERHPYHQAWGSLNRATQEMIWDSVQDLARPPRRRVEPPYQKRRQKQRLAPPRPERRGAALSHGGGHPLHARQLPHRVHRGRCLSRRLARSRCVHLCARAARAQSRLFRTRPLGLSRQDATRLQAQTHPRHGRRCGTGDVRICRGVSRMPRCTPSTWPRRSCATATSARRRSATTFIFRSRMPKARTSTTRVSIHLFVHHDARNLVQGAAQLRRGNPAFACSWRHRPTYGFPPQPRQNALPPGDGGLEHAQQRRTLYRHAGRYRFGRGRRAVGILHTTRPRSSRCPRSRRATACTYSTPANRPSPTFLAWFRRCRCPNWSAH